METSTSNLGIAQSVENFLNYEVFNSEGHKIGKIKNLWITEDDPPLVAFFGVKTGFLGKLHVIPAEQVFVDHRREHIHVPYDERVLEHSPAFSDQVELTTEDQHKIMHYFGNSNKFYFQRTEEFIPLSEYQRQQDSINFLNKKREWEAADSNDLTRKLTPPVPFDVRQEQEKENRRRRNQEEMDRQAEQRREDYQRQRIQEQQVREEQSRQEHLRQERLEQVQSSEDTDLSYQSYESGDTLNLQGENVASREESHRKSAGSGRLIKLNRREDDINTDEKSNISDL